MKSSVAAYGVFDKCASTGLYRTQDGVTAIHDISYSLFSMLANIDCKKSLFVQLD